MRYFLLSVVFLLNHFGVLVTAQIPTKDLTLKDAVLGQYTYLYPQQMTGVDWLPGTHDYVYVIQDSSGANLVKVNASTTETSVMLSLADFNKKLDEPIKNFPQFHWLTADKARFTLNGKVYTYDFRKEHLVMEYVIPKNAENIEFRDGSIDMAYTIENNLYAVIKKNVVQITSHQDKNIVSGQTVSRVEFGINKGIFWSPNGKQIAFYEKDESLVTNYPLVEIDSRPAHVKEIKYPMAGMESEMVKVGIYTISSGKIHYLKTKGDKFQYLTSVTWEPSGKHIYVANLTRNQRHLVLKKYSAKNGDYVLKIMEETNRKYVHPVHPLYFVNDEQFLWVSERSGLNHFYMYSVFGENLGHLNCGDVIVQQYLGYDPKKKRVYFLGNQKDRIERQVFELYVSKDMATYSTDHRLIYNFSQHTRDERDYRMAKVSSDGKYIIANSSSPVVPNEYELIEVDKETISTIFTSDNPLADYKIGKMEIFHLPISDSVTLYGRVIKPYDFDPFKKYPLLLYVYNGPGVQLIRNSWLGAAPLWMYYFANKGYIVLTIDGRGSANRGLAFEQVTFGQLGQIEMKDQMTAIDFISRKNYIDKDRIAVHGWSYGGFMTISLMENYPDVFKVGVAGGPVTDWHYYEVMYTERYMGHPGENLDGYKLTSTLDKTDKIKGKLMIIHGTVDPVVVIQQSELFLKSCVDNGVQVDFFEYPGHEHNVRGKDRVHLMKKVLDYIEQNLE